MVIKFEKEEDVLESIELKPKKKVQFKTSSRDASTQVLFKKQIGRYSLNATTCDFENCMEYASAGTCDYRVCCSKGCQRNLCDQHIVKPDEGIDDDALGSRVCVECQGRANRAFYFAIFLVVGLPLLAMLPAIFFYGD